MADLLPEEKQEVDEVCKNLHESVGDLEKILEPLFAFQSTQELSEKLNGFDMAKFNIVMAYSINSLFYSKLSELFTILNLILVLVWMKTQGLDTNTHPVKGELVR